MTAPPVDPAVPVFVVVGNVNQGKSSVVAALTEDAAVPIDSYPGTTKTSGEYVFRAGDKPLFKIVDTPGFQRARQALAWLQARAASAAQRPAAVRAFVEELAHRERFPDEIELLRPVLAGAGILYVVDASSPLEPANEAEMEILRWTGQPAMALLNRVRGRDHTEQWRPVLRQFFHLVREFDAHRARFPDRIALLRGFREIRHEWAPAIDAAVAAMERHWRERTRRAVREIAELLVVALGHVERKPLPEGADETALRGSLEEAYRDAQRKHEAKARAAVEAVFGHPKLDRADPGVELLAADLFAEVTWRAFGLTRGQLVRYGATTGAIAGGAIDLAVAGASFLAGTAIGAAAGAALGWFAGAQIATIWNNSSSFARALFPGETGRFLAMGPVTSARYAWVLLDRALVHFRTVRDRSHARRDALGAQESATGIVSELPRTLRDPLEEALRKLLADLRGGGGASEATRHQLVAALELVGTQLPPPAAPGALPSAPVPPVGPGGPAGGAG